VGKTKLTGKLMHLKPEKARLLKSLAEESRVPQSVLMREAIDDLLMKYRKLKPAKGPTRK
jgi:predicted transcriptional regulator